MPLSSSPLYRRHGSSIEKVKWSISLFAVIAGLILLYFQWRAGRIGIRVGNFYSWTGYYQWISYPSVRAVLSVAGGLVAFFIVAGLWPRRLSPHAAAAKGLCVAAALAWGLSLAAMHMLQIYELPWLLWLIIVTMAIVLSYFLIGSGGDRSPLERLGAIQLNIGGYNLILIGIVGLGALLYAAGLRFIFDGQPVMSDSQSQIAQARLLLSGHFRLDITQPLRDVIAFPYAMQTVPSYVQYAPGHIFLLMPAIAAGIPVQTVSIAAGTMTLLVVMLLSHSLGGRHAATVSGLLMLASPLAFLMNSEAMNHATASLMLWTAAFILMPRPESIHSGYSLSPVYFILGGAALAWAGMTRPLTALAHGVVWAVAGFIFLFNDVRKGGWQSPQIRMHGIRAGLVVLGMLPVGLLFVFYNWKTTGSPLVLGYAVSNPELHRLGFHAASYPGGLSYTPLDAARSLGADLVALNWQLFGLAFGSWVLLAAWWVRTRFSPHELIIASLILSQIVFYKLYQFHDLYFGPRFMFELIPAFALLAGLAVGRAMRRSNMLAAMVLILLLLMTVGSVADSLNFWPRRFVLDVRQHRGLEQTMKRLLPNTEPLAIIIPDLYAERVGRWFPADRGAPPVWFIPVSKETAARTVPELAGARWTVFDSWVP